MQVTAIAWALRNFPTGMGIGREGPGGSRFNTPEDSRYTVPPESYFVSLIFETGVIGFLLVTRIFWSLASTCVRAVRWITHPELHALALATAVVLLGTMLMSFTGPTLYTSPLCYLFWTLAGLLFRLIELEQENRRFQAAPR
jgi:hypothetical protein